MKNFEEFSLNEAAGGVNILQHIPQDVTTVKDAEQLILGLSKNGLLFHFDDDPHEIVSSKNGGLVFTEEEADKIQELMEKAFDVCNTHYGIQHGLWEGLIKGVFFGYIAFSAEEKPDSTVYVVEGSGGPGKVRTVAYIDYQEMESEEYNNEETDKWFQQLQILNNI
jgi:hypothetical protein